LLAGVKMTGKLNVLVVLLMVFAFTCTVALSPASAQSVVSHTDFLYAADFNHDIVHVYDVSSPTTAKIAAIQIEKPAVIVASQDGKHVYVASSGLLTSGLYSIGTDNNSILARYSLPDNGAGAIAISPDDRYVYVVTSTRLIILETSTGKIAEKTLPTDRYTTLTAANDHGTEFAFTAAPGSSQLILYNGNDGSVTNYHLNCEIGQIEALDGTHLLGTDKLGEINALNYNYYTGIEGWSYTPHPIGRTSTFFEPYIAISNNQKMAYFIDQENNQVYRVNLGDYTATLLTNSTEWRSPTRAAFSTDNSKVFICDDTGVTGLYTSNNTQYKYFYGYKALDVDVASVPGPLVAVQNSPTPTLVTSPSPHSNVSTITEPSPIASPTTIPVTTPAASPGGICPTLAILPLLMLGIGAYETLKSRRTK